jgi:hypothetical protein
MAENRRETGARKLPAAAPTGKPAPDAGAGKAGSDTAHGPFGADLHPDEDGGHRRRRGRPEDGMPPAGR